MILRLAYISFLGIILALFVSVGIAAFYPSPKAPDYNDVPSRPHLSPDATESAVIEKQEIQHNQKWEEYSKRSETYSRNVSIIALIASLLILTISLTLAKHLSILADGLLVGSVLTLLYSIARGFSAEEPMYRFIVVTIGLLVALLIGYIKFVLPQKK